MKNEYTVNPDGSLRETCEIPGGRGVSLFQSCQNMMLAGQRTGASTDFSTTFFFLRSKEITRAALPPA